MLPNGPSVLNMTLTGGTAPQPPSPVPNYVNDMGNWNATTIYQPVGNPMIYPMVTYTDNHQYVACWYAAGTNVPGKGDPWRLYDANKNVCTS